MGVPALQRLLTMRASPMRAFDAHLRRMLGMTPTDLGLRRRMSQGESPDPS